MAGRITVINKDKGKEEPTHMETGGYVQPEQILINTAMMDSTSSTLARCEQIVAQEMMQQHQEDLSNHNLLSTMEDYNNIELSPDGSTKETTPKIISNVPITEALFLKLRNNELEVKDKIKEQTQGAGDYIQKGDKYTKMRVSTTTPSARGKRRIDSFSSSSYPLSNAGTIDISPNKKRLINNYNSNRWVIRKNY